MLISGWNIFKGCTFFKSISEWDWLYQTLTPFLWLHNVTFLPSGISLPESFPRSHLLRPEAMIIQRKHPACHSDWQAKQLRYGFECQFAISFPDTTPNLTSPISFGLSPFTSRRFSILALLRKQQEPWKHPPVKTDCAQLTNRIDM